MKPKNAEELKQKEIQEYRKASAEALGLQIYRVTDKLVEVVLRLPDQPYDTNGEWQPDKDANQMLMVWEWLKDQGHGVYIEYYYDDPKLIVSIWNGTRRFDSEEESSLLIAFMKAFMEYLGNSGDVERPERGWRWYLKKKTSPMGIKQTK